MDLALWIIMTVLIMIQTVLCIILGVNIGISLHKDEKELPKVEINPVKAVKEHKANKEAKKELDRLETILANIENYDGTSNNQADVPGR